MQFKFKLQRNINNDRILLYSKVKFFKIKTLNKHQKECRQN